MFPSLSATMLCGLAAGGKGYSFISPVLGSNLPTRLAHIPVHQIDPSGASIGSRVRCPRVGVIHSVILIFASPDTSDGRRSGVSGNFEARYPFTQAARSARRFS